MATVSILFVDQVGSTAQLSQLGDPAAAELHDHLHGLLGRFLDDFDGTYENFTGDGLMASFGSCVGALECGLAVQDALREFNDGRRAEQQLVLRMGLHTGEPLERSTGPYGAAVVVAARLCEQAGAGQLLVSDVVRALVEPRRAFTFVPVGARRLKGFPGSVVCHLVRPFHPAVSQLPVELNVDRGSPFIGRAAELEILRRRLTEVRAARAALVLVLGQEGAGKTRLVREFGAEVDAVGARVVTVDATVLYGARSISELVAERSDGVLVVIVDDVEVGEQLSVLVTTVESRAGDPLLVVVTSENLALRSEVDADTTVIDLDGLSADSVGELVESIDLGSPAPDVIDLTAGTGGLPGPVLARLGETSRVAAQTRLSAAVDHAVTVRAEDRRALTEVTTGILTAQRPELSSVAADRGVAPYKGLMPYGQDDVDLFCGREEATSELLARLTISRFVAVTGSSGSGKSSLINAGLLAALASDAFNGSAQWPLVRFTPGATPLVALARSLINESGGESAEVLAERLRHRPTLLGDLVTRRMMDLGGERFVIVVDQFEEVFTQCRDERDQEAFIDALVHCAQVPDGAASVVVALRGDYYGRCSEHAELARAAAASHFLVGPMTPSEIRYAVEEPARRSGLRLEPELADRAVDDASGQPGLLPLLSTAMLETWKRRDNGTLTLDGYETSGGVSGAISSLAESVYEHLSPDERRVLRAILLRLAELGEDGDDVRRRAARNEVATDPTHQQVLDTLINHRLITADETSVEVAHEALLREWPRLRAWLEEDRSGRRLHRRLTDDAQTWAEGDRNNDLLYRGVRLESALDWAQDDGDELSPDEAAFLAKSSEAWQQELERSQQTSRRLRLLALGLAGLLLVAVAAGVFALGERNRADERASAAEAGRTAKLSDLALEQDVTLGALLAVEAWRNDQTPVTEGALLTALNRFGVAESTIPIVAYEATFSPGGLAAIATESGDLVLWDLDTKQAVATIPAGGNSHEVSADGRYVSWESYGSPTPEEPGGITHVIVWDIQNGEQVGEFPSQSMDGEVFPAPGAGSGFLADGRLAIATEDGTTVWDVTSGEALATLPSAFAVIALRQGDLGVLTDTETLTVWDLDSYEVVRELPIPPRPPESGFFGPPEVNLVQGPERQVLVSINEQLIAVDVDSGAPVELAIDREFFFGIQVSDDGTRLVTEDVVWDLTTQTPVAVIDPGSSELGFFGPGQGGLSPDGSRYLAISQTPFGGGQVTVLSTEPSLEAGLPVGEMPGPPITTAIRPDGTLVVVSYSMPLDPFLFSEPGTEIELQLSIVDLDDLMVTSGRPLGPAQAIAISRDGSTVVVATGDEGSNLTAYDVESGSMISTFDVGPGKVVDPQSQISLTSSTLVLSPNGARLAVQIDGDLLLIDTITGQTVATIPGIGAAAPVAAFTGQSKLLTLDTSGDGTWTQETRTVDGELGEMTTYISDEQPEWAALTNNDRYLVVGGRGSTLVIERESSKLQRITGPSNFGSFRANAGTDRVVLSGNAGPQIWDLATLQPVGGALSSAFFSSTITILADGDTNDLIELTQAGGQLFLSRQSLRPQDLVTRACALADRNLTDEEWQRIFGDEPYRQTCP